MKKVPNPTSKQAGVVDQNSIFVIGANYLIDQFENKYGDVVKVYTIGDFSKGYVEGIVTKRGRH